MKILVISDTHGSDRNLNLVLEKEKGIDLMIHLGDLCGLEDYIEEMTGIPCYMVLATTITAPIFRQRAL